MFNISMNLITQNDIAYVSLLNGEFKEDYTSILQITTTIPGYYEVESSHILSTPKSSKKRKAMSKFELMKQRLSKIPIVRSNKQASEFIKSDKTIAKSISPKIKSKGFK